MAKPKPTPIDPDQAPAAGGSYLRDPDTGALTRVEGTDLAPGTPAEPAPAESPAESPAAAGDTPTTSLE